MRLVDEDFDHFLDKELAELTDHKKVKEKNRR
jgi:hypothetical protein